MARSEHVGRWEEDFHAKELALQGILEELRRNDLDVETRRHLVGKGEAAVASLTQTLQDGADTLTPYEKRNYSSIVKYLRSTLSTSRSSAATRPKFGFKAERAVKIAAHSEQPAATRSDTQSNPSDKIIAEQDNESPAKDSIGAEPQADQTISSLDETLHTEDLTFSDNFSVSLSAVNLSAVFLRSSPNSSAVSALLASLFVQKVKNSLIVCEPMCGGVHVTDADSSTFVLRGRQVRIHAARDCLFYLHSSSNPIIEGCSNLRFAALPAIYAHPDKDGENLWGNVNDFQWLRSDPNPHWQVLASNDQRAICDEDWEKIQEQDGGLDRRRILDLAKIDDSTGSPDHP